MYTVDYFINKFESIPEERWIKHQLFDDNGNCCANGHCGVVSNVINDRYGKLHSSFLHNPESRSLNTLFNTHLNMLAHEINDHGDKTYYQPTPKQRILAALYDIKKMQYPELSNTTVEDLVGEAYIEHKN